VRLLDLFCGAGGASVGYARAGWEVVGVDLRDQPRYPFEFHQADALSFDLSGFDAIHASPPCQGYSGHVSSEDSIYAGTRGRLEPLLIDAIRDRLVEAGVPYVIENVVGARPFLWNPVQLCGVMFGLPIPRHRLFESPYLASQPRHPVCRGVAKAYAAARGWDARDMTVTGKGRRAGTLDRWAEVMGIDWPMTQHEMRESIPPSYTEWVGTQLIDAMRQDTAA
jgi:DNA (cytosine-5)-methyltransferase 1